MMSTLISRSNLLPLLIVWLFVCLCNRASPTQGDVRLVWGEKKEVLWLQSVCLFTSLHCFAFKVFVAHARAYYICTKRIFPRTRLFKFRRCSSLLFKQCRRCNEFPLSLPSHGPVNGIRVNIYYSNMCPGSSNYLNRYVGDSMGVSVLNFSSECRIRERVSDEFQRQC